MKKKKVLKIVLPVIAVVLALSVAAVGIFFNDIFWKTKWFIEKSQTADVKLTINANKKGEVFEGFGASACWWSQLAGDSEYAEEIAKLLYSKEGLGLNIYRYNIGAGSADNPDTLIENPWRRTESFYVLNEATGEYEYDFTRDAAAQKFLDLCLSYGCIDTVVLFANSPHYSMTLNGKASGNEEWWVSNISSDKYEEYAKYLVTIAEYFIKKGVPVKYISPINEPNWSWGSQGAGQEGCFYNSEDIYAVYRAVVKEIKAKNLDVKLTGPESGEIGFRLYEWFEYLYNDEEIRPYLGTLSYHSYWTDDVLENKIGLGKWIKENVDDIPVEMSEWCHLPCTAPIDSIDGALVQARVMANDLNFSNINSWTAWVGVNDIGIGEDGKKYSDGLLAASSDFSEYEIAMRYYAVAHFSKFIPQGSVKISTKKNINDIIKAYETQEDGTEKTTVEKYGVNCVSYLTPDGKIVTVVVNEGVGRNLSFKVDAKNMTVYTTTQEKQLEETYKGKVAEINLPEKSIMTIVFE
ncbi:MAG: glycoside hydrolase [Candidatus Fimenecus sp.]